jgi:apolipoprotein N-acyltransferase
MSIMLSVLKIVSHPFIVALLSGLALGIGFITPALSPLVLGGIIGSIYLVAQAKQYHQAGLYLMIVWTVKSLCAISWFWSAYPIEWIMMVSPLVQIISIFLYWVTGAFWLGLGGGFFGYVLAWLRHRIGVVQPWWYVVVPFVWLLGELIGAIIFSVATIGPGSFIQSYFSFGSVGYLLGYTPLGIQLATIAGVYGLTVLVVLVGTVCVYLIQRQFYRGFVLVLLIVGIGLVYSFPSETPSSKSVSVISINTHFEAGYLRTEEGQAKRARLLADAVTKALSYNPQYILLPEDSRYLESQFGLVANPATANQFGFLHQGQGVVVIDSGRVTLDDGTSVLRAHVLDTNTNTVTQFDKQYLVPQGEYIPTFYKLMMYGIGSGSAIDAIVRDSSYHPGPLVQSGEQRADVPAVLFCFESVHPWGVMSVTKNRSVPFVAHPISHAWFHSPQVLWQQLDVMLQIQARYSGLPIVSAGNMVTGKMYTPNGNISSGEVLVRTEYYELRRFEF